MLGRYLFLVYVYIDTGAGNSDGVTEFQIYTSEKTKKYSYYLYAHGYNQNSWSYNSDNFWLPITSSRTINVTSRYHQCHV